MQIPNRAIICFDGGAEIGYTTSMFCFRLYFVSFLVWLLTLSGAQAFDTLARAAFVLDVETGAVLLEKNANTPMPPASMSKLMTLNVVFEALKDGRIQLDTRLGVSAKAAAMGGSKMFVRDGARVRVVDLLHGVIVQSGNDACVVLAEGLAGTEEAFAEQMNQRAKELGLSGSHFKNASGWPAPGHYMSMRDLVILSLRLIEGFPEYYDIFSEEEFTWENITQRNRNPLLGLGLNVDGLKTGHTEEAGYGLVGSAVQNGRRVVFAIAGLTSKTERAEEGERILVYAFRQFSVKKLFGQNYVIGAPEVWLGQADRLDVFVKNPITVLIPAGKGKDMRAELHYMGPLKAPIKKGQEIGKVVVNIPGVRPKSAPVFAATSVGRGGFLTRLRAVYSLAIPRLLGQKDALSE